MTTFCLVHGAWHDDACWELLVGELDRRGHECLVPTLPLDSADATFEDYAQVVVDRLERHAAPVLVGHSMSAAVIPLIAVRRSVRMLVYLCPAMGVFPAPGDEPPRWRAGYERPPVDASDRSWWPRDQAISRLYAGVEPEVAERLAVRLRPQPQQPFSAPYPLQRAPAVPATVLYARDDELFDDAWSQWIARQLLCVDAIELPGGHFPMLEHPALLADLLEQLTPRRALTPTPAGP